MHNSIVRALLAGNTWEKGPLIGSTMSNVDFKIMSFPYIAMSILWCPYKRTPSSAVTPPITPVFFGFFLNVLIYPLTVATPLIVLLSDFSFPRVAAQKGDHFG